MKTIRLVLSLAVCASAFAQSNIVVRWHQVVGVITAPGVDNPVAGTADANGNITNQIHSGAGPWTTRGGSVHVNLATGEGAFNVEGLVLNGGSASGTSGPVKSVMGTLVCNPATAAQAIVDTPAVDLSAAGNAELSFRLSIASTCTNPLFLIRIPQSGRWIATAAMPVNNLAPGF